MNPCIVNLLNDENRIDHFIQKLPIAFEMASNEVPPGNPAIGILREHVIIGYFIFEFGQNRVSVPTEGNKRGFDVIVCDEKLSIKTVTGNNNVTVVWTVDQSMINQEISGRRYQPECDLFLVTIHWEHTRDSIFYIPISVQLETYDMFNNVGYLNAKPGTNHRGITISTKAIKAMKSHPDTLKREVTWTKHGTYYTPYERWEEFWKKD